MNQKTYHLEFITPCFCAGADQSHAEIRASSIRGQLRWWFRALGGFKSLSEQMVSEQEKYVFGSIQPDKQCSSNLVVRNSLSTSNHVVSLDEITGKNNFNGKGYILFPLRSQSRSCIEGDFMINTMWRGSSGQNDEIHALFSIFCHLGSLGFRSRRGLGAVAGKQIELMELNKALSYFNKPESIIIKNLKESDVKGMESLERLGIWLKSWRAHGRSQDHQNPKGRSDPPNNIGFKYAKNDHDIGYGNKKSVAYRASLGLPIIQKCQKRINSWEWSNDKDDRGRFASPVILRPYQLNTAEIISLVIFVDCYRWPRNRPVYFNETPITVSDELYNAMRSDNRLTVFSHSLP